MNIPPDSPVGAIIVRVGAVLREHGPMTCDDLRKRIPEPETKLFYRVVNSLQNHGLLERDDQTRVLRVVNPEAP